MRKHWLDGFHFTRNERQGVQLVLILSVLGFAVPSVWDFFDTGEKTDFSELQAAIVKLKTSEEITVQETIQQPFPFDPNVANYDDFIALGISDRIANRILNYRNKGGKFFDAEDFSKIYGLPPADFQRLKGFIHINKKKKSIQQSATKAPPKQQRNIVLADFDPNTASFEQLCSLGLSERTAHSVINYRTAGGSFKYKADFQKIYTLDKADFQRLYAYIDLPEKRKEIAMATGPQTYSNFSKNPKPRFAAKDIPKAIDINQANQADWEQLQGIGPYFSKKIIQYREKLGGFTSLNQVAETYNLPDSVFQHIRPYLRESAIVTAIDVNTADVQTLAKHPYIKQKQAKLIVAYRKQHGTFSAVEELLNIKILNEEWLLRVKPYLRI